MEDLLANCSGYEHELCPGVTCVDNMTVSASFGVFSENMTARLANAACNCSSFHKDTEGVSRQDRKGIFLLHGTADYHLATDRGSVHMSYQWEGLMMILGFRECVQMGNTYLSH